MRTLILAIAATAAILTSTARTSQAGIVINEVLGSTVGTDYEYIELYNSGPGAVDISNWKIELWDSDLGTGPFGGSDAGSPYTIGAGTILGAGDYFLFANARAETLFGFVADFEFGDNSIENSSYTVILANAANAIVESVLVIDNVADLGGANRAGVLITPNLVVGLDGTFLGAGFARVFDGSSEFVLQNFSNPVLTGTPGVTNGADPSAVPEPSSLALLAIGGFGFVALRRRAGR